VSPVDLAELEAPSILEADPVEPRVLDAEAWAWSEGQIAVASREGNRRLAHPPADPAASRARPRRRTRSRRGPGRIRAFLAWAVAGLLVGLAAVAVLPGMLGYHSLTVLSGSMEPTIHVGDVVVEHSISPLDARIGDIVTFRDPGDQHILITHRVRAIRVAAGTVHFTTKGDANNAVEGWTVPIGGTIGLVQYHIRRLGFALVWGSSRNGRLALVVLPSLLLGLYELVRIWRPKGSRSGVVAG
jgi:signal peptidase I